MNLGSRFLCTLGALGGLHQISAADTAVEFKKLPTEAWSAVIPAEKNISAEWEKSLFERGAPRGYTGEALMNIGMPVSGITTGSLVYLGGDGKLWNWDIFNRKLTGVSPRQIQYKDRSWHGLPKGLGAWQGGNYIDPVRDQPSPFEQGFALSVRGGGKEQVRTLDRNGWKEVAFTGAYPLGTVSYSDPECPVKVALEAYSPFSPLDYDDSSYPATIMSYRVENTGKEAVTVEIGGWLENPVLIDNAGKLPGIHRVNTIQSQDGMVMLVCTASSPERLPDSGSIALAAIGGNPMRGTAQLGPQRSVFATDGLATASSTPDKALLGGVTQSFTLAPGASAKADFAIAWHFVNVDETVKGAETGLHYGKRFKNAAAVVEDLVANFNSLAETTRLWNAVWYDSTLPYWLLERMIIPLNCLASPTCYRFADGRFYTYEGIRSCPGHPNHVWHYAQAHARLFPELEQDVIERTWYGSGFHEDGSMAYRGEIARESAIDGHCGVILSVLRAHQTNPDDGMLKRIWPRVKKSIEYANTCDNNGDGLLDPPMLTTLDEPWHGEIPWVSSLYLAALKAGEEMASDMGDTAFAADCRRLPPAGAKGTRRHGCQTVQRRVVRADRRSCEPAKTRCL